MSKSHRFLFVSTRGHVASSSKWFIRTITVLFCLLLGAIPTAGQSGGGPLAPFILYTRFERPPAATLLNSARAELTVIMGRASFPVEWKPLDMAAGEVSRGLAVMDFKGNCDASGILTEHSAPGGPLGWTYVTDGQILPFGGVDCDLVRELLAKSLNHLRFQDRQKAYGRAIARVLAHELYHMIAGTQHHSASGVAQPAYTASDLMATIFSFTERDERVLADRLAPHPPGMPVFTGSGCIQCHGPHGEGAKGGPVLRAGRELLNAGALAARLADKQSKMYQKAEESGSLWPILAKSEIEDLVAWLNTALE
jgi:mono/diheme cytochrome c family protein